jgi:hypothetical protein
MRRILSQNSRGLREYRGKFELEYQSTQIIHWMTLYKLFNPCVL